MYSALRIFCLTLLSFWAELSLGTIDLASYNVNDTSKLLRVGASRIGIDHRNAAIAIHASHSGSAHAVVRNGGNVSKLPVDFSTRVRDFADEYTEMNQNDNTQENDVVQRIPKIVHHVFFNYDLTKDLSSREAWPNDIWFQSYQSWKKHFPEPEYQHIFWSPDKTDRFFRMNCSKHYEMYRNLKHDIQKSDMSRNCLLWHLGGIYADLDYEPIRNFYSLLRPGQVNLIQSPYVDETVQNSLMASPAHHQFWDQLMSEATRSLGNALVQEMDERLDKLDGTYWPHVLWSTGPKLLSRFVNSVRPSMVHVLPCDQFQPLVRSGSAEKHCKKLSIADVANNIVQGIHWGTQLWSGGNGLQWSKAEFKSFHHALLEMDQRQLHDLAERFDKVDNLLSRGN